MYNQFDIISIVECAEKFETYIKELVVQYDENGIVEIYNKIKKIHDKLENISKLHQYHEEDFEIVKEIKQEYIETNDNEQKQRNLQQRAEIW